LKRSDREGIFLNHIRCSSELDRQNVHGNLFSEALFGQMFEETVLSYAVHQEKTGSGVSKTHGQ
jgi:hypothetical protein